MKRTSNTKSKASALFSTGVLLSAGAQAMAQGAAKPAPPSVSSSTEATLKYAATFEKWRGSLSVVGTLDGRPVFKTDKGEYFHVEPSTGDLKFHSAESLGFIKLTTNDKLVPVKTIPGNNFIKYATIKIQSNLSVLGVDAQGHLVEQNSRGERFYLSPNGDMVFLKSAATFKFAATFEKWRGSLSVEGLLDGRPVFKTAKGEYFQLDPNTGDLKFYKYATIKLQSNLSVLGVDAQGHLIQQNSRGEKFYLNPNGDLVYVK
jgi:hypothetical protein